LRKDKLDIPDLKSGNYIPVINEEQQYAIKGSREQRQRVINNLPGTVDFCPLISKTEKLEKYINAGLADKSRQYINSIHSDILQRTSAFLLVKDSQASFTIEGESPKSKRAAKWGQVIGQAGSNPLTREELIRLQEMVIENARFLEMGFRTKGGFVGEHNRTTGYPIPDHISARCQDVEQLINGMLNTHRKLLEDEIDAVIAATIIAFGFVYIHPFEDGNGRIHRYLIHHVLAKKKFSQQGIIFPISAAILDRINDYREVLQSYSHPILEFIEWEETSDHNIEVLNDTLDFYRYFNATRLAEFLYECVEDTMTRIIPEEVRFLQAFDQFKRYIDDEFEMPDRMVALLVRFLGQNGGKLSNRARVKEFKALTDSEFVEIEKRFVEIFGDTV
jgi:Fic family protein